MVHPNPGGTKNSPETPWNSPAFSRGMIGTVPHSPSYSVSLVNIGVQSPTNLGRTDILKLENVGVYFGKTPPKWCSWILFASPKTTEKTSTLRGKKQTCPFTLAPATDDGRKLPLAMFLGCGPICPRRPRGRQRAVGAPGHGFSEALPGPLRDRTPGTTRGRKGGPNGCGSNIGTQNGLPWFVETWTNTCGPLVVSF